MSSSDSSSYSSSELYSSCTVWMFGAGVYGGLRAGGWSVESVLLIRVSLSGSISSGIMSRDSVLFFLSSRVVTLGPMRHGSGGKPSFLIVLSMSLGLGGRGGRSSRGQSSCLSGYITIAM